jgi:hypothetical protein
VRKTAIFQLKLLADGLRDALLIPISLGAALIGLIRGGDDAERELQEIFKLGRRSERWINLFGQHKPLVYAHPARSMDAIIDRVESVVREQYQKGKTSAEEKTAIEEALEELRSAKKAEGSVEE